MQKNSISNRIDSYRRALEKLRAVLEQPKTDTTRDASIKRFEFTYELAWKSIQDFLREQGIVCASPKGCLKEAFKFGLIPDNPLWTKIIDDRNLTVHTYDEGIAEDIYSRLKSYIPLFEELLNNMIKMIK